MVVVDGVDDEVGRAMAMGACGWWRARRCEARAAARQQQQQQQQRPRNLVVDLASPSLSHQATAAPRLALVRYALR